ncbi:PepSY-associated TM helix domain-containing protein [Sphingosinicella rhizophila]|uniref:PepSY-associated TM helix domain-containing protein n=1 Tax=Sphingosinicella rhizophila TaxID=3050082 RepID=A0ABU3QC33_9SPHN|nr:PepSY-associated TM helix domain-containing protein [Sphingosinicella sp. GR2756]MDT9600967.1 PepSY-associated TM helix domain-containing protein [Sphingosinicella sp. GR2756]
MTSRTRILLRRFHLWLGLGVGGLLALLGLTGSALVFYVEIDEAIHPAVQQTSITVAPDWSSPVWDRALATGRAHRRDPHGTWSLEATGKSGAIPARYYPSARHGHHAEREMVWFSPDGSEIVRAEPWGGYLMSWLYELHMHLLAGAFGSQIVGWSGFAMLVLLISGVVAWWPRGSWRKALAFKRHAVPIRRLRDLHKHAGLWSMALLSVLAGTGALLALPSIKVRLLSTAVTAPDKVPAPLSSAASGRQISVAQALAAAHRVVPDGRLAFIDVPGAGPEPFRMRVRVPGDPHRRFPSSFVFVDQYSGRLLAVHDIRRGNASTKAGAWIRTLHDGSVGGMPLRILAMILGLIPTVMFVTGFLHWRRRIAARAQSHPTGSPS